MDPLDRISARKAIFGKESHRLFSQCEEKTASPSSATPTAAETKGHTEQSVSMQVGIVGEARKRKSSRVSKHHVPIRIKADVTEEKQGSMFQKGDYEARCRI